MKISTEILAGPPDFAPLVVTLETRVEAAMLLSLIGGTSPVSRTAKYKENQILWAHYPWAAPADLDAVSQKYSVLYNAILNSLKERK